MGVKIEYLDPKKYSYGLFESDVNNFCKKNRITQQDISQDVIVRSASYLGDCIRKRKLPENCFRSIVKYIGQDVSRYKIIETPVIVEAPVIPEPTQETGEWNIKLLVNEDFGVVRCMLNHGLETIAVGSCDSDLKSGAEIIKAISVAMNRMTSKLIPGQQPPMKESPKQEPPKQEAQKPDPQKKEEPVGRQSFKDWIMQYYDSHSDVGRLARFVDEHYNEFPTWGEVKMQRFLQLTVGGKAHLGTFNAYFDHYRKKQQAEEAANSSKLKSGVVKWV